MVPEQEHDMHMAVPRQVNVKAGCLERKVGVEETGAPVIITVTLTLKMESPFMPLLI